MALVALYFGALFLSGPAETMRARWSRAGVHAPGPTFLDLRLFPAARAEFAAGGNPYVLNPRDPSQRPYNYPRLWLSFMRFSADDRAVRAVGVSLAMLAFGAVLFHWGRLSVREGVYAGILVCSPAVMLGVDKGNTDLLILALLALSLARLESAGPPLRLGAGVLALLAAAVLKLFPVLGFFALPARSFRQWARIASVPLVIFALYVAVTFDDVAASLRNTGMGWVQAYGTRVPVLAAKMARSYYGLPPIDEGFWYATSSALTLIAFLTGAIVGWKLGRQNLDVSTPEGSGTLAGFRAGALIYCATYLAGTNFDYRQSFLLLTLPQLFRWCRASGLMRTISALTLGALLLSCGINYVMAGWPGFFVNEIGGLLLGCLLTAAAVFTWRSPAPAA